MSELRKRCDALLGANARSNGSLKIMVLAEPTGCAEILVTRALPYGDEHYTRGFRLNVQPDPVHRERVTHKSTNYLAQLLGRQTAKSEARTTRCSWMKRAR